jgi:hypothetical protein
VLCGRSGSARRSSSLPKDALLLLLLLLLPLLLSAAGFDALLISELANRTTRKRRQIYGITYAAF